MADFETLPYKIKFKMELDNYTHATLIPSGSYIESGYISTPAMTILPGQNGTIIGEVVNFSHFSFNSINARISKKMSNNN